MLLSSGVWRADGKEPCCLRVFVCVVFLVVFGYISFLHLSVCVHLSECGCVCQVPLILPG